MQLWSGSTTVPGPGRGWVLQWFYRWDFPSACADFVCLGFSWPQPTQVYSVPQGLPARLYKSTCAAFWFPAGRKITHNLMSPNVFFSLAQLQSYSSIVIFKWVILSDFVLLISQCVCPCVCFHRPVSRNTFFLSFSSESTGAFCIDTHWTPDPRSLSLLLTMF